MEESKIESELAGEEPTLDVEVVEEPRALQEFHAVSWEVAVNVSRVYKLAILFKERDKTDLYGRNQVFLALPKEIVEKLLKCRTELVPKNCFVGEETEIVRCLLVRGWLAECTRNGVVYVCNLSDKTAKTLKRQLSRFRRENNPEESGLEDEGPAVASLCSTRK
jgi:hypothetical protein